MALAAAQPVAPKVKPRPRFYWQNIKNVELELRALADPQGYAPPSTDKRVTSLRMALPYHGLTYSELVKKYGLKLRSSVSTDSGAFWRSNERLWALCKREEAVLANAPDGKTRATAELELAALEDKFMNAVIPLVKSTAERECRRIGGKPALKAHFENAFSAGLEGAWNAFRNFDPTLGKLFSSYIHRRMGFAIGKYFERHVLYANGEGPVCRMLEAGNRILQETGELPTMGQLADSAGIKPGYAFDTLSRAVSLGTLPAHDIPAGRNPLYWAYHLPLESALQLEVPGPAEEHEAEDSRRAELLIALRLVPHPGKGRRKSSMRTAKKLAEELLGLAVDGKVPSTTDPRTESIRSGLRGYGVSFRDFAEFLGLEIDYKFSGRKRGRQAKAPRTT